MVAFFFEAVKQGDKPAGRWYYSGGQLAEPHKVWCDLEYGSIENAVEFTIPGAKLKISR